MSSEAAMHSLVEDLDTILRQYMELDDEYLEAKKVLRNLDGQRIDLEAEARRIRLALFALSGRPLDMQSASEANAANHQRRQELTDE